MKFCTAPFVMSIGVLLLSGCANQVGLTAKDAAISSNAAADTAEAETNLAADDTANNGVAHPDIWPSYTYPVTTSAETEQRIAAIIARMTIEEKVGQLVQADLCCVTAEDVKKFNLGSVLNGGNSGPYGNDTAPAADWLKAADEFYEASVDTSDGGVGVPVIWGTDAVHGHSNIIGATIFPHNIGLGAMRDVGLIERIAQVTAKEIRVTGQEWTFAPTVAVPQDFRWGRAYEGYSSDPKLVASYVGAMVRGLQGAPNSQNLLAGPYVIASTKHFLSDGGTENGVDQGDAKISEQELRDIHGLPYGPAIENGVATVMASFSSWQGRKMTGNKSLLTDVLKEKMGFGGFVLSDWNAHGQVEGCTNESCPQALNAGIDLYMAPDTWRQVYADLLAKAKSGELSMQRIDEANAAILRVKMRLGLFEAGKPSDRLLSGEYDLLGAAEHREVAREAVRKSLVMLKNQGVLPLKAGGRLLVAGEGANNIARQSGGWTISWQGTGIENESFPGATSIFAGFDQAVKAAGGSAELSPDGSFTQRPDAAIVVFGEKPYAEFQGDRPSLTLDPELTGPFETMQKLKDQGIPVIALMITGRPLYVNPALNMADAFVVAWLPGSEGGGIADVLVGDQKGQARHNFVGKLPAAWPKTPNMDDGELYAFGYGLDYSSAASPWTKLAEVDTGNGGDTRNWFKAGVPAASWSLLVAGQGTGEQTRITSTPVEALNGRVRVTSTDYKVQEGARRFTVTGGESSVVLRNFEPVDLDRETNADILLLVTAKVFSAPQSASLAAGTDAVNGRTSITLPVTKDYVRYGLPLKCLRSKGADMKSVTMPFILTTKGAADFAIAEVRLGTDAEQILPCP